MTHTLPPGPEIVFGLVTYNSREDLVESFGNTVQVAKALGAKIVVCDNGSTDETVRFVKENSPATVVGTGFNGGFAHGVNHIFAAAGDRDVLLLNPDVRVDSVDQVLALRAEMTAGVGLVAPRLRNPDGSVQQSARSFPTVVGMAGRGTVAKRSPTVRRAAERYTQIPTGSEPTDIDWAIGAAMLISNQANREVGGWDEGFFLYLEDVDFCLRLARAGWRRIYTPHAELVHTHHRASAAGRGSIVRSQARRHHVRSTVRFFAKHRSLAPSGTSARR